MLSPFFVQAAVSPGRQKTFRAVLGAHLCLLAVGAWSLGRLDPEQGPTLLGSMLLLAGIVEGAILLGWRLTQLPRSQALEFLLVSPLRPSSVFLAEALVGLARLAFVTVAGLPVLALLSGAGRLDPIDLGPLLLLPWTWGAVTGLGLTTWAYEPRRLRRWGERGILLLVIVYLGIGVLAGEHLRDWLASVSPELEQGVLDGFSAFHRYNPFAVLHWWLEKEPRLAWKRTAGLELAAVAVLVVLLLRAATRLKAHFRERHYQPAVERSVAERPRIGEQPLTWWAVKRVSEYSGRINLWLAGGCGLLYAVYVVAGPAWPDWLGKRTFQVFDGAGGIPVWGTALMVLAAVPAAFQYGLWDSSTQDRCRRLELLLLTGLDGRDYWQAAAAAAWRRGRGYFGVAGVLWLAALLSSRATLAQVTAALAAGVLLWGLYFALGFRAFGRGRQANTLGMLLTLGLPLLAYVCCAADLPLLAALVPPGSIYQAGVGPTTLSWLPGPVLTAVLALGIGRHALKRCDRQLRDWYDRHHGSKVLD